MLKCFQGSHSYNLCGTSLKLSHLGMSVLLSLSIPIFLPSPFLFLSLSNPSPLTLNHRDLPQKPSEEIQAFVSVVAHGMVRLQERDTVLSPWSLMALILLQNPEGLALVTLTQRTAWLRGLVLKFGAHLDWPGKSLR